MQEASAIAQKIQLLISEQKTLIEAAKTEPRLKGPFPHEIYEQFIGHLQFLLDRILTIKLITPNDFRWNFDELSRRLLRKFSEVIKNNIVEPLKEPRESVTTNMYMSLWIMAESIRSKAPVPKHLPNAMKSRRELVAAFKNLPAVQTAGLDREHVRFRRNFCKIP